MFREIALFVVLVIFVHFLDAIQPVTSHCGYQSCPNSDPKKLNIHIVPHSHDDVGWLKTVDQYYNGDRPDIQKARVKDIIDTVVDALQLNPERRFIQVETAFFWKWWKEQSEKTRDVLRDLVNEGRLEMIGGGWSMADEAVTHYQSLVDQYTWGFRRLNDTLGKCGRPRIGWQIDPFGHSREQASMFARLGFDGLFLGRLDHRDKRARLDKKEAEFIWKGSPSLGKEADIFTGVLFNNYGPPRGFCFDTLCSDQPIIDDMSSPGYNIPTRIDEFLGHAKRQSHFYRTNNVIITMGGDFHYQNAHEYYTNLDKLIRYSNRRNGTGYNMFYSTPSCYLKSLHEQNLTWSTKSDDFFPHTEERRTYWTGYFTSRPNLKYFERQGNNYLQVVKQLSVLAEERSATKYLEEFRETMGVMQHHDAVTGTEKQKVAEDYARLLHESFVHGNHIMETALRKLVSKEEPARLLFYSCLSLNASSCEHSERNDNFVLTVYNPTSQVLSTYVRIPVAGKAYTIKDYKGLSIKTDIAPIAEAVLKIPGRSSKARYELIFEARKIPALGFLSFYISSVPNRNDVKATKKGLKFFTVSTKNKRFDVSFNEKSKIVIKPDGLNVGTINISFHYYESASPNYGRSSGAYIFKPGSDEPTGFDRHFTIRRIFNGSLVKEFQWHLNDWISGAIRFYAARSHVEFDWLVGPIDTGDHVSKEVITRFSTDLKTDGTFYTDSNGREMIERKRNFRPTYEIDPEDSIASNYYPVTNKIFMEEKESGMRLAVLTDRAQGGSSLKDGEIELMVHRRLVRDDGLGVDEVLEEDAFGKGLVTRGQHLIVFGHADRSLGLIHEEKSLTGQLALKPWLAFTPIDNISHEEYQNSYKMKSSGLRKTLPKNVQILTLEPWKEDTLLLRLEHLYEVGESSELSQPVKVNIRDLFSGFEIVDVEEMTLGANQRLDELNRFEWKSETNELPAEEEDVQSVISDDNKLDVLLKPKEIRTYIIKVTRT